MILHHQYPVVRRNRNGKVKRYRTNPNALLLRNQHRRRDTTILCPTVHVVDDVHMVTIVLDMPGVKDDENDIKVMIDYNNILTVAGRSTSSTIRQQQQQGGPPSRCFYYYRQFNVDANQIDTTSITADWMSGVLTIMAHHYQKEQQQPGPTRIIRVNTDTSVVKDIDDDSISRATAAAHIIEDDDDDDAEKKENEDNNNR
mmetsp:Transcript_14757/g.22720  ORF Transcript_14757/g.22720 Transcript_14757/m.22720 type:complete len:200 (-) Transcript_14757:172-771(-)